MWRIHPTTNVRPIERTSLERRESRESKFSPPFDAFLHIYPETCTGIRLTDRNDLKAYPPSLAPLASQRKHQILHQPKDIKPHSCTRFENMDCGPIFPAISDRH